VRRALTYFLTAIFLIALLSFTISYTVRFTDVAVVTTFGKADTTDVRADAGLYFKMPYPIQSVTIYDKRMRILTNKFEQLATKDNRQVAVETFCMWRVEDPLKFFRSFSNAGTRAEEHYARAEGALRQNLRAAAALVSQYDMNELFSASRNGSKLKELQDRMLASFRGSADDTGLKLADYGIVAEDLGLMRVVLTEEVSKAVMERMRAGRDLIVKETQSQGQAMANSIRTQADSDASRITQFADFLAQKIKSQGEREAEPYYAQMNDNPQLAQFNANMEFIREVYAKKMTMVVSSTLPGIGLLFPDAADQMRTGQIPPMTRQPKPQPRATGADTRPGIGQLFPDHEGKDVKVTEGGR
jgi:membrane protease subunit HflC